MTFVFGRSLAALVLLCPLLAGCGDRRNSAPVSGTVTVRGQPMADIAVNFEPSGGGAGLGSVGKTDASGKYTLRFVDNNAAGALVGSHKVTFSDLTIAAESSDGGAMPRQKHRFPVRYTSEPQDVEVQAGGTTSADFDLK